MVSYYVLDFINPCPADFHHSYKYPRNRDRRNCGSRQVIKGRKKEDLENKMKDCAKKVR